MRFRCILGGTLSSRTCRLSPLNRWLRSSSSHHKSCGAFLENHSRARLGQWWSLDPTSAYLLLCVVHKQRVVLIFKLVWQDKRIVVIIHDMWKSYDIYILAPINKVLLRHGQPHSFSDPVPCAMRQQHRSTAETEIEGLQRYLLSGLWEKTSANPCSPDWIREAQKYKKEDWLEGSYWEWGRTVKGREGKSWEWGSGEVLWKLGRAYKHWALPIFPTLVTAMTTSVLKT